jgi:DNA-binding NtrC family response regulator
MCQAKLLRAVEHRTFRRVGDAAEQTADIRVIAASNRPLASNGFRDDLYHRLGGVVLELASLRDRKSDVPVLAQHFLDRVLARRPDQHRVFSSGALEALEAHEWPGNVRELKNVVERAAQLCRHEEIGPRDLFDSPKLREGNGASTVHSLAEIERAHILRTLEAYRWNISKASRTLGISRSTLYQKITDHGLRDG